MKRLLIVLLIGIGVVCCSASQKEAGEIRLHVPAVGLNETLVYAAVMLDPEFTDEEVHVIQSGIYQWEESGRGLVDVEFVPMKERLAENLIGERLGPRDRCVDLIVINKDLAISTPGLPTGVAAVARRQKCFISSVWLFMDMLRTNEELKAVAAHEFGHAIGMDHTDWRGSIMYPTFSRDRVPQCITKPDMEEFCDKVGCYVESTMYCIPNYRVE